MSVSSFFQTFAFNAATYYLALFFQVCPTLSLTRHPSLPYRHATQAVSGATAIQAGLLLLPFSLGSALISLVANMYISNKGEPKHMVILGFGISALGFGAWSLTHPGRTPD